MKRSWVVALLVVMVIIVSASAVAALQARSESRSLRSDRAEAKSAIYNLMACFNVMTPLAQYSDSLTLRQIAEETCEDAMRAGSKVVGTTPPPFQTGWLTKRWEERHSDGAAPPDVG